VDWYFGLGLAVYTKDMQLLADFNEYNNFCSNTINQISGIHMERYGLLRGRGLVRFAEHDSFHYEVFQRDNGVYIIPISGLSQRMLREISGSAVTTGSLAI
jgi:hypothetical protein